MINEDIKKVEYFCKLCSHKWELQYPINSIPPAEIKCPNCNRIRNHRKPYNFFKDNQK